MLRNPKRDREKDREREKEISGNWYHRHWGREMSRTVTPVSKTTHWYYAYIMHADFSLLLDWLWGLFPSYPTLAPAPLILEEFKTWISWQSTREMRITKCTFPKSQWTSPWIFFEKAKVLSLTWVTVVKFLSYDSCVPWTVIHTFFGDLLGIFIWDFCCLHFQ